MSTPSLLALVSVIAAEFILILVVQLFVFFFFVDTWAARTREAAEADCPPSVLLDTPIKELLCGIPKLSELYLAMFAACLFSSTVLTAMLQLAK